MNTDFPTDPREALEASLTALLLDELPADQAVFLRDAIARDPELARRYERLKATIELVRITAKTPAAEAASPPPILKLSQERRQELLQHFKTVRPKEFAEKPHPKFAWLVPASIAALLMALCGALLLPVLSKSRSQQMLSARFETMRESFLDRRGKDSPVASENQLAETQVDESLRELKLGLDKSRPVSFAQATGARITESKIVLPIGGRSAPAQQPPQAAEPAAPLFSPDSFTVAKNDANAWSLASGGGGLGGAGGPALNAPVLADAATAGAAFRRRYGLETEKAAKGFSDGEKVPQNENAVAMVDPVTGLPAQSFSTAEPGAAAVPTISVERDLLALKTPDIAGKPADAGVRTSGSPGKDSRDSQQGVTATVRGFYDDAAKTTNGNSLPQISTHQDQAFTYSPPAEGRQQTELNKQSLALNYDLGEVPRILSSPETLQRTERLGDEMRLSLGRMEQQLEEQSSKQTGQQKIADSKLQAQADSLKKELAELDNGIKEARNQNERRLKARRLAQPETNSWRGYDNDALIERKPSAVPVPQPEVQTRENAFSTFSLNVSDVSFKLAAASLEKGALPDPAGIRVEEFINTFDYRDPEPGPDVPIGFAWDRCQYPFAQNRDLVRFSLKTAAQGRMPGRPLNLVLLLDSSGSMERADRVRIIQVALRVLAAQLQPQDTFSVVTFARVASLWVDGIPGNQAAKVAEEISGLTPQGGTNLEEAMNLAYQTALRHYLPNGVNRVVLLTDGAANLGNVDPDTLKQKVETNRKQGIAFDCFGIGWEGYNDDLLEVLTRNGDGRYGFINTPEEAAAGFANQIAGALHTAAADVKVQVEFNSNRVTAYRQIGYAKHQLTKEQFRDNTVDAAELGAAESGNALYVIEVNPNGEGPIATVRVRYKVPGTTEFHEHEWPVPYAGKASPLTQASPAVRLAVTASALGEWLSQSPYAAQVTPDALLGYLNGIPELYGADTRPKTLEWMIRQAKSVAGK